MLRAAPDTLREGWHFASEDVLPQHKVEELEAHVSHSK